MKTEKKLEFSKIFLFGFSEIKKIEKIFRDI